MGSFFKKPGLYVSIVLAVIVGLFCFSLYKLGILPIHLMLILCLIFFLVWAIIFVLLIKGDHRVFSRILGGILAAILAVSTGLGTYYLNVTYGALSNMSQSSDEIRKVASVYVLNNGVITEPSQLNGRTIGVLNNINTEGSQGVLNELQSQGISVEQRPYDSSILMINDLKGQAIDSVILDQSYLANIEDMDGQENIRNEIKPVLDYEYTIKKAAETASNVNTATTPFNVLISGIDTYGAIEDTSRSDVNMVASINPKTHEILMISIPRDYYVETVCDASAGCALGQRDKLTHTGLRGVQTTEMTLENLLGIDINYYVRVNFSSLETIINELGGIDVENVDSFTSLHGNYTFEPGIIHMDGPMALGFVRERYSFQDGDRERGKNQMRVLTAIIDKMTSPAILSNFAGIMNAVGNSFETNMSVKDMTALVNAQLSNNSGWQIYNYSLNGTGGTDFAPELGDNAYVMYPDEATVSNAKADIDAVHNGEVPPYINQ
ncbi:LCP family protein [Dubosiella newyorkensis]|uniref:LCP family protein n=1 Tax=Dubosiella newyorkensis TaxID=1862672 RepID=UPI00258D8664|nr:LCP family protein [Dubosiella newyorkensis]